MEHGLSLGRMPGECGSRRYRNDDSLSPLLRTGTRHLFKIDEPHRRSQNHLIRGDACLNHSSQFSSWRPSSLSTPHPPLAPDPTHATHARTASTAVIARRRAGSAGCASEAGDRSGRCAGRVRSPGPCAAPPHRRRGEVSCWRDRNGLRRGRLDAVCVIHERPPEFLNLDKPYPGQIFTIVIWGEDRGKFGSPEIDYRGKHACVTGKISEYRGTPEMIATCPEQLKVDSR
jgi:hypothetical protein